MKGQSIVGKTTDSDWIDKSKKNIDEAGIIQLVKP